MNKTLYTPFTLPREEIRSQLAVKPGSHFEADLEELFNQVTEIAQPKAIYRVSYVEARQNASVTIEDTTFNSLTMSANLEQIRRVFPFIATCGKEVEGISYDPGDLLKQYWLNAIKLSLLNASMEHLRTTLKQQYQLENLSAINPGSGDASVWPIEEQLPLFSLFGGTQTIDNQIGVRLQPSFLMLPEMSVSGILFPSESSYTNCQLCQREDCPGRRAHFDADLWETIQMKSSDQQGD